MTRLSFILSILAAPAFAQDTVRQGGDIITLRESSEGHVAELYYSNAGEQLSKDGSGVVVWNGIRVRFTVKIGTETTAERLHVQPEDETLIALPDTVDVPDGEGFVVQIVQPSS